MAGQVIQRGERAWLVRVILGRDPRTKKRRYFNKMVHGNKKDAQRAPNGLLRDIDLGVFVEPSNTTLGEYLDQWLESAARPRLSERTFSDYSQLLKRYIREPLGGHRLSEIKPLDIQGIYGDLQARGLSARTIRSVHIVLSNALKQAVRWQLLAQNPAQYVELPRQTRQEMRSLSQEEAAKFLKASTADPHGLIFAFALSTGMRPEEYLAVQWKDVDLGEGTVAVQRTLC